MIDLINILIKDLKNNKKSINNEFNDINLKRKVFLFDKFDTTN